jgi:dTDP-4-amino-4,6-dideoxygalactose transaminase
VNSSYQYFAIRINEAEFGCSRDQIHRSLKQYNIISRKYFYPLCSDYECYRELPSSASHNLPVANRVVRDVLCLPLYGDLSVDDIERICETLLSFQNARTQPQEVMIGV